jgi:hypothetical protein
MMLQNETAAPTKPIKMKARHSSPRPYEVDYLMRLGNLSRPAALALIAKHGADRFAINADLMSMRRRAD